MEWKTAVQKMIKLYWDGKEPDEYNKVAGERKYKKDYFDKILNEKDSEKDKKHGSKQTK